MCIIYLNKKTWDLFLDLCGHLAPVIHPPYFEPHFLRSALSLYIYIEMQVQPLGQEYSMEEEMETHSSILAWKIPWTEKPGGLYSPEGHKESDMTE